MDCLTREWQTKAAAEIVRLFLENKIYPLTAPDAAVKTIADKLGEVHDDWMWSIVRD